MVSMEKYQIKVVTSRTVMHGNIYKWVKFEPPKNDNDEFTMKR